MTAKELHEAEARYRRAFRRSEAERQARNAAVREALLQGWTHAQIADATGLTRARVGQIALGKERDQTQVSAVGPGFALARRS
jgi:hypothetical protein